MDFTSLRTQNPATFTYLGSPSLVCLNDRLFLASHDYFGPGCPRNQDGAQHLTSIYRSEDAGQNWTNLGHISGAFWSTLFQLESSLYLLGTSAEYGSVVIRRSQDAGFTWTHPQDDRSGLLLRGGPGNEPPNYHCAPVPVLVSGGRIYRAFENFRPTTENTRWFAPDFLSFVISCPLDADLLDARNWTVSNALPFKKEWCPPAWSSMDCPGWLEGNILEDPRGKLVNILRLHSDPLWDRAACIHLSPEGERARFDPSDGLLEFPGGKSKFTIRRDPETDIYLTLSNANLDQAAPTNRSVLSWHASLDLQTWHCLGILLQDDGSVPTSQAAAKVGFQYVDWQFCGDDLVYLVRTAYGGAHNFHDSNRITFHRLKNFRSILQVFFNLHMNLDY